MPPVCFSVLTIIDYYHLLYCTYVHILGGNKHHHWTGLLSAPAVITILLSFSWEAASYKDNPPLPDVLAGFCFLFPPQARSYHVDSADGAQTSNVELGQDDCR